MADADLSTYLDDVIPPFDSDSGNLPPGIHAATWDEVVERYGGTAGRRAMLESLRRALASLKTYGCRYFYLNGSFVSAKREPGDYDGCWDVEGVDVARLAREAPLLWDDSWGRLNQKREYGGDVFPVRAHGDAVDRRILEDFQRDKVTRQPKGIIQLDLEELP